MHQFASTNISATHQPQNLSSLVAATGGVSLSPMPQTVVGVGALAHGTAVPMGSNVQRVSATVTPQSAAVEPLPYTVDATPRPDPYPIPPTWVNQPTELMTTVGSVTVAGTQEAGV